MDILGIFAREPQPGECKTRLASAIGPVEAASLAEAFLGDLAQRFQAIAERRFLCYTPDTPSAATYFRELSGGLYELWIQPPDGLGQRLNSFFRFALDKGADRVVVIGGDAPTFPTEFVEQAFATLGSKDVVLSPAADGGFCQIGIRGSARLDGDKRDWLSEIEWSTASVLQQTIAGIASAGWTLGLLPPWYDVDTIDDVEMLRGHLAASDYAAVPCLAPRTARRLGLNPTA